MRWVAIAAWAAIVVYRTATDGFAFNRELVAPLHLQPACWLRASARAAACSTSSGTGCRSPLVLVAYDLSRGAADLVGRPTLWQWQADADRWLFFGTMPTVWLQERLKLPQPPWWEVVLSTVYMSFFILPYVVAGVLWLRNRDEWKAFVKLFVGSVLRGAGDLRAAARRAAVGRRPLHSGRRRRRPVRARAACSGRPAGCPTGACSALCRPARTARTNGSSGSSAAAGSS